MTINPPASSAPATSADAADVQRSFRDLLGCYATGVVLITAATPNNPVGMAANSFTSVSLDPPLVSCGAAYSSTTWPSLKAQGGFSISVLGRHHESLCRVLSARGVD